MYAALVALAICSYPGILISLTRLVSLSVVILQHPEILHEVLNGEGPFTLFLPTNEAFEKLPNDVATDKGQRYTSISR